MRKSSVLLTTSIEVTTRMMTDATHSVRAPTLSSQVPDVEMTEVSNSAETSTLSTQTGGEKTSLNSPGSIEGDVNEESRSSAPAVQGFHDHENETCKTTTISHSFAHASSETTKVAPTPAKSAVLTASINADPSNEDRELRLILLGCSGSGKSATANTLLGVEIFRSDLGASCLTTRASDSRVQRAGYIIQVVDTAALWEEEMTMSSALIQLCRSLELACPGPHAFLYVTAVGQWSRQDQENINKLRNLLGPEFDKHLVTVFTRTKELGRKPLQDYVDKAPSGLKELLSFCGQRYAGLDNKASTQEKEQQVAALLKIVEDMVQHTGSHFSTELTVWMENEKTALLNRMAEKLKGREN